MTYVRIDDRFPFHRKAIAVGPAGRDLFVCGLAYSNLHLTDGFIPTAAVFSIAPGQRQPVKVAGTLVEAGLWEKRDDGWAIHDYHKWNKSKAEVADIIELKQQAGRVGGRRSGEARRKQRASNSEADAKHSANNLRNPTPTPTPPIIPPHGAEAPASNGPRRYPPELFHADCPDPTWRGQCVDRAYVDAHAAELGGHYPVLPDGSGGYRPRSCEAHR